MVGTDTLQWLLPRIDLREAVHFCAFVANHRLILRWTTSHILDASCSRRDEYALALRCVYGRCPVLEDARSLTVSYASCRRRCVIIELTVPW